MANKTQRQLASSHAGCSGVSPPSPGAAGKSQASMEVAIEKNGAAGMAVPAS